MRLSTIVIMGNVLIHAGHIRFKTREHAFECKEFQKPNPCNIVTLRQYGVYRYPDAGIQITHPSDSPSIHPDDGYSVDKAFFLSLSEHNYWNYYADYYSKHVPALEFQLACADSMQIKKNETVVEFKAQDIVSEGIKPAFINGKVKWPIVFGVKNISETGISLEKICSKKLDEPVVKKCKDELDKCNTLYNQKSGITLDIIIFSFILLVNRKLSPPSLLISVSLC